MKNKEAACWQLGIKRKYITHLDGLPGYIIYNDQGEFWYAHIHIDTGLKPPSIFTNRIIIHRINGPAAMWIGGPDDYWYKGNYYEPEMYWKIMIERGYATNKELPDALTALI